MNDDERPTGASRFAGAIRGWMLVVPPLGLVALVSYTALGLWTGGDLNRRINSTPEIFRVVFSGVLMINLTVWIAWIRVARLPLPWKTRLELMASCGLAWAFAIPLLELVVMPESDGLPPGTSDDFPEGTSDDAWHRAFLRFRRKCAWAFGIYLLIVVEIVVGSALWSRWRG